MCANAVSQLASSFLLSFSFSLKNIFSHVLFRRLLLQLFAFNMALRQRYCERSFYKRRKSSERIKWKGATKHSKIRKGIRNRTKSNAMKTYRSVDIIKSYNSKYTLRFELFSSREARLINVAYPSEIRSWKDHV